jgi:hypothetical protein
MDRRSAARSLCVAVVLLGPALALAQDEDDDLRQRLTEREDKRRPPESWSTQVAGRPLVVSGEYEIELRRLWPRVDGDAVDSDRLQLEHGLEAELFYPVGPSLALFAQARLAMERDLLPDTVEDVSDLYVERGELWVFGEDIGGSHLNVDAGRLHFEDERRWWWDEELDAVHVEYEREAFQLDLAVARELAPARSDRSYVEPEHERVRRLIGEASFDWAPNQGIELFLLRHDDHSPTEQPGRLVRPEREDDSDARLTWLGARALGALELRSFGILGYWLDGGLVRGHERVLDFDRVAGHSVVTDVRRQDVSGWGIDLGLNWNLPGPSEPRVFAGYALGSGDSTPDGRNDSSYRQSGIHRNEAGFGGVERFGHYGAVLEPELSNLEVVTAGAGLSLWRSSSLDLVYHRYRLVERATSLRDDALDIELDGAHRDLGQGLDLVLALEEWERLELELLASTFRAGRAAGSEHGAWSTLLFVAIRYSF